MAEHKMSHTRWTDALTAFFVMMTVLVGGWYLLVWFDPDLPLNPFPPPRAEMVQPALTPSVLEAVYDPSGPTPTFPPTWTPTVVSVATPTRWLTSIPRPTRRPTETPRPDPLLKYYIPGMIRRSYQGGQVSIHGTFGGTAEYTAYLIFYESEGLRISGMMNVPTGQGHFPVVILCHGYIHPDKYATGNDTWREAEYLAKNGYLTIAPDYRSHAASDNGASFYHIGYAQDILNLIASLDTVEKADTRRVGLWGHSMGGAVALKTAVVSRDVDAVAVFGSVSADERINYIYGMGNGSVGWFGSPDTNGTGYKLISPIYYLERSPPLSIHHGTGDSMVPYTWSEDLYKAAQRQGATAELHLYPGAEHTFVGADWDLAMERTLAFYDEHVRGERQ